MAQDKNTTQDFFDKVFRKDTKEKEKEKETETAKEESSQADSSDNEQSEEQEDIGYKSENDSGNEQENEKENIEDREEDTESEDAESEDAKNKDASDNEEEDSEDNKEEDKQEDEPKKKQPESKEQESEKQEETEKQDVADKANEVAKSLGYEDANAFLNYNIPKIVEDYKNMKEENDKIKQENEELYNQYSEVGNPFKNEVSYKFNKLQEDNPNVPEDVLIKIAKGNFSDMNDREVLKLNEMAKDQDMTQRSIERQLKKKFDIEDWSDIDDEDIKEDIKIARKKAEKKLSSYVNDDKYKMPENITPENIKEKIVNKNKEKQQTEEDIKVSWQKDLENFNNAFREMPIPVFNKDKGKVVNSGSKYVLSDNKLNTYKKEVEEFLTKNNIKPSKQTRGLINDIVRQRVRDDNFAYIVQTAVDKARNEEKQRQEEKKYNPSKPKKKKKTPDKGETKTLGDLVAENKKKGFANLK